jgi:hypothetical protein
MLRGLLVAEGCKIGRRHVKTLMRRMGIEALYRTLCQFLSSFASTSLQEGHTKMSSSGRNPSFGIIRRCFHGVAVSQAHNSRRAVGSWRPVFNCKSLARLASAYRVRLSYGGSLVHSF